MLKKPWIFILAGLLAACGGDDETSSGGGSGSGGSGGGGGGGSGSGSGSGDNNDSRATADLLSALIGEADTDSGGSFVGSITPSDDEDFLYFDIDPGVSGTIRIYTVDTRTLDPYCTLRNSSGSILETSDDDGSGDNCEIERTVSEGRYYFVIASYRSSSTGGYTIRFAWSSDDNDACSGNDCSEGADFISGSRSGSLRAQISPAGDVDWFYAEPDDGAEFTVYTEGSTDTFCEIYRNDRGTLTLNNSNDDGGQDVNCRVSNDGWIRNDIDDRVYFLVRGFDSRTTGNYVVNWEID